MQRLDLNFVGKGKRSRWAGRALLALAVAASADAALTFSQVTKSLKENEKLAARSQPRSTPARPVPAEEIAAARDTVERLALPWPSLFAALEGAANEQIALLAIEPDAKAGTVRISGDSKDYLAALTYVLNLSRSDALSKVELVRHEVKQNDPQHPVSFSISAAWTGAK